MILPPDFHFLRPEWFWALVPCALLIVLMARFGARARGLEKLCDPALLPHLVLDARRQGSSWHRWWPAALALFWLISVTALAGPVWQKQPSPVFHLKTGRVIVLDLSSSMEAGDMKPSRLKRAVFKIRDMLAESHEGLTGLVVFGAEPFVVVPLTDDTATIEAMLPALSTGIIPVSGDSAAGALKMAADLLLQAGVRNGEIILVTDGISDMASTLHQIAAIRKKGMRLSVMGVGTDAGAPVPEPGGGFIMDSAGKPEISRLDTTRLAELAKAGGGVFTPVTPDDSDIRRLFVQRPTMLSGSIREKSSRVDRWQEQGAWLVLLLLPAALAAFRRGWLLVLSVAMLAGLPSTASAFKWQDLWQRQDQQAWELYEKGRYQEAAGLFKDPDRQAAALYHAGKYAEASKLLDRHRDAGSAYNRGNSLAKAGKLQEALKAYDEALKLNPDDKDAQFNRNLVKKLLEQQKQQDKQNKEGKQGSKKKPDDGRNSGNKKSAGDRKQNQSQSQQQSGKSGDNQQGEQNSNNSTRDQEENNQTGAEKSGANKKEKSRSQQPKQGNKREKSEESASSLKQKQKQDSQTSKSARAKAPAAQEEGRQKSEKEMALEQWLRQIPDDPSGLLRRKFYMEHQRRQMGR